LQVASLAIDSLYQESHSLDRSTRAAGQIHDMGSSILSSLGQQNEILKVRTPLCLSCPFLSRYNYAPTILRPASFRYAFIRACVGLLGVRRPGVVLLRPFGLKPALAAVAPFFLTNVFCASHRQSAHKKLLDVGNTLGLSRSVMRMIENRQNLDKMIVYGGMLFTLLFLFGLLYFFKW
jgi:hypothetical protein